MAAIDVPLVGGDDRFTGVVVDRELVDFEFAGGEEAGWPAVGRDCIKVQPPVFFPGEQDAAGRRPRQLPIRNHWMEDAAHAGIGAPKLSAGAGGGIGDTDSPGLRTSEPAARNAAGEITSKGELRGVRRPDGIVVAIYRGVEISDRPGREGVDRD